MHDTNLDFPSILCIRNSELLILEFQKQGSNRLLFFTIRCQLFNLGAGVAARPYLIPEVT